MREDREDSRDDWDNETEMIMNKIVSDKSAKTYLNQNVKFFTWIFDNEDMRNLLFAPFCITELQAAADTDLRQATEKKRLERKYFREAAQTIILSIRRGNTNTFPIFLDKIDFNIFTMYMNTRKKIIQRRINNTDECEEVQAYLSKSMYDGMRSALMHLYRTMGVQPDPALQKLLTQFIQGLKKVVAEDKKKTGQKLSEGKRHMSREVFEKLCKIFMKGESDEYLFAHCFLTLEWNLMARADNVVDTQVSHIEWHSDCLVFHFAKQKGSQEGECVHRPWHVYANPLEPDICPVLAFAKYILTMPGVLEANGSNNLFPGNDQYRRFMGIFTKVLKENADEFKALGYLPSDLGSHSTRKGSATLVATGCTIAPPFSAICLRAGWSMGSVKERYIHYEKAGDQFVGRTVCGLSCLSSDFAVSPCYFDFTDTDNPHLKREQLNSWIRENIVGGRQLDAKVFYLTRFLFASVCYHFTYLTENCHPKSRLMNEPLISQCPEDLRKLAVVKYPWNCTTDTPKLSGVPPHVIIMSDLRRFETKIDKWCDEIMKRMVNELNERDIGGGMHHATHIRGDIQLLRDEIKLMQQRFCGPTNDSAGNMDQMTSINGVGLLRSDFMYHEYGGRFNVLPEKFQFPSLSLPSFISHYLLGNKTTQIPPLRILTVDDLKRSGSIDGKKTNTKTLSDMKKMMKYVEQAARDAGIWEDDVREWNTAKITNLYEKCSYRFHVPPKKGKRRYEQIVWKSYLNILKDNKGLMPLRTNTIEQ